MNEAESHWQNVYTKKSYPETSWFQEKPEISLSIINELELPFTSKIIDIGGGDSNLVDFLMEEGYRDISVLDISAESLKKAEARLGANAEKVTWINADVTSFKPTQTYHLWHDRAAFHFLNEDQQIENYVRTLENSVIPGGFVIMATFSKNGPTKCSGRTVKQYDKEDLENLLEAKFNLLESKNIDHNTPTGAIQNFTFCCFRKK
ncbi:Methyltransferase domain-containing protein [Salegentibacter holothuriorum]|uniref:Methyltransferase domain-containing protein n=1 Tax=Salegentibacter holothuriorum TaxID=241145 RepID=A0A1T5A7Y1_9FLAO|nr:class I SAM-dependent methyltransferase [Salegentibacter holothuriorum]SKB30763.1 Methyltransferase domain-containing protein [Salegentibacter holothuriorum]